MRGPLLPLLICLAFLVCEPTLGQKKKSKKDRRNQTDTLYVEQGKLILFADTLYVVPRNTILIVQPGQKVTIKDNPYSKSEKFYDSLEHKSY